MVGRPGFPGQRPSKPRRIEPAGNHTGNNVANHTSNHTANHTGNNVAKRNNHACSSNPVANHPPDPRANQPSSVAAGARSLQIISSSDVARSSNQRETRPIEVICGPGGEASVRCEGTLSEVKDCFHSIFYLMSLSTGRRTPDSKSACQYSSREFLLSASHLTRVEPGTCVSGAAHGACVWRCSQGSCFRSGPSSRNHL